MVGQRGGNREGAGRKPLYDEPTKVVRVPESRVIEIKNYLAGSTKTKFNDVASITLVNPSSVMSIPLASEKVAAGFPSPAQDYVDKTLDMNEHLIKNEAATFVVRVASLSMRDAGIEIDDELIVDRSIEAKHEDIVIALIDNEEVLDARIASGFMIPSSCCISFCLISRFSIIASTIKSQSFRSSSCCAVDK